MRNINDVLHFREDISPFLTHLTTTEENLHSILTEKCLKSGEAFVSSASYGLAWENLTQQQKLMFRAVCFTDTPLREISSMFEISKRKKNFKPFGLLFSKVRMRKNGVSPVLCLNNEAYSQEDTRVALQELGINKPDVGMKILPLFSHFGETTGELKAMDFTWEREWRYPAYLGDLNFSAQDVFIGLCPEENIEEFEGAFGNKFKLKEIPLKFVDPMRSSKWYASKLVGARNRMGLKYSVV